MLTVSDWPIIMVGPDGLLLVVPHVFAVRVSVLLVGLQKRVHNQTWMWKIFSQGHILSTAGDALRQQTLLPPPPPFFSLQSHLGWGCHVSHILFLHAGFAVVFNWACVWSAAWTSGFAVVFNWACVWSAAWTSIFAGTFTCLIDPRVNRHLHWSVPSTSWVRPLRGLLVNPKIVQFWFRERSNQKTNLRFLLPSRCCWFTQ